MFDLDSSLVHQIRRGCQHFYYRNVCLGKNLFEHRVHQKMAPQNNCNLSVHLPFLNVLYIVFINRHIQLAMCYFLECLAGDFNVLKARMCPF